MRSETGQYTTRASRYATATAASIEVTGCDRPVDLPQLLRQPTIEETKSKHEQSAMIKKIFDERVGKGLKHIGKTVQTDLTTGLIQKEVEISRAHYGENETTTPTIMFYVKLVGNSLIQPMTIFLLMAILLSFVYNELSSGIQLLVLLCFGTAIDIGLSVRLQRLLVGINRLAKGHSFVFRDGVCQTIPANELVVGDVVFIYSNDVCPADILLIASNDLLMDESEFTGMIVNVQKQAFFEEQVYRLDSDASSSHAASVIEFGGSDCHSSSPQAIDSPPNPNNILATLQSDKAKALFKEFDVSAALRQEVKHKSAKAANVLLSGTRAMEGSAIGIVINVGKNTLSNRLGDEIAAGAGVTQDRTPLEIALGRLSLLLGILAVIVVITVMIVANFVGYQDPQNVDSNKWIGIMQLAVSFALCTVPENMPTMLSFTMARYASIVAHHGLAPRKVSTVETLGCTDVICFDKTGTLTRNHLVTQEILLPFNRATYRATMFPATTGYKPSGHLTYENSRTTYRKPFEFTKADTYANLEPDALFIQKREVIRCHSLAEPTGARMLTRKSADDPIIATGKTSSPMAGGAFDFMDMAIADGDVNTTQLDYAAWLFAYSTWSAAYNGDVYQGTDKQWHGRGNATDCGARCFAYKLGVHTEAGRGRVSLRIPYNNSRKCQMVLLRTASRIFAGFTVDHVYEGVICINGAIDLLLPVFDKTVSISSDQTLTFSPYAPVNANEIWEASRALANMGLRIIGTFIIPVSVDMYDELILLDNHDARHKYIMGLTGYFVGLHGMSDTLRPGLRSTFAQLQTAGVTVKVLTGDQVDTTVNLLEGLPMGSKTALNVRVSPLENLASRSSSSQIKSQSTSLPQTSQIEDEAFRSTSLDETGLFCRANINDKDQIVTGLKNTGKVVTMVGDGFSDLSAIMRADIGISMGTSGSEYTVGVTDMILVNNQLEALVKGIYEGRRIYDNICNYCCYSIGSDFGSIIYLFIPLIAQIKAAMTPMQIVFANLVLSFPPALSLILDYGDADIPQRMPRARHSQILPKSRWLYSLLPHMFLQGLITISYTLLVSYLHTAHIRDNDVLELCVKVTGDRYSHCYNHYFNLLYGWGTELIFRDAHEAYRYIDVHRYVKDINPAAFGIAGTYLCDGEFCAYENEFAFVPGLYALMKANTMSFLFISFSSIYWVYIIRSAQPFWKVASRSIFFHAAASFSVFASIMAAALPGINVKLAFYPISSVKILASAIIALIPSLVEEYLSKPYYRKSLIRSQLLLESELVKREDKSDGINVRDSILELDHIKPNNSLGQSLDYNKVQIAKV